MSSPDFPDHLEQGDDVTAELLHAVDGSCTAAHTALKLLLEAVRKLDKRVVELKAQARPPIQAVTIHSLPPPGVKRTRGRPKGTQTRNRHVYVTRNGFDPHP